MSWVLTRYDSSSGMAYTLKDYRKMDLFIHAAGHRNMMANQMKMDVYALVTKGNVPASNVTKKYDYVSKGIVRFAHYFPLKSCL